ncbi:uncharacterized protein LOC103315014 isoform X1 [Tribolium castaneum]|uniref:uncharacterized protein LOC103315014 isoform X1 n=2 Tax=Tribolium castaneum TaxID=7070 RepID=UPI0030FF2540
MDRCFKWPQESKSKNYEEDRELIFRLQSAKRRLSPIVDDIVESAVDLIEKGDDHFVNECTLTPDQYQDVIWASQMLRQIEYDRMNHNNYYLPNTNLIVNRVSVESVKKTRDKSAVVIDQATVVQLLQLYDQMGVIIQKMLNTNKATKNVDVQKSTDESRSDCRCDTTMPASTTTTENNEVDSLTSEKSALKPCIKSTCSAFKKSSSSKENGEDSERKSVSINDEVETKVCDDPTIYIKIQCYTDCSETAEVDATPKTSEVKCSKSCDSHYHIKLDGEPVTLKMNQTNHNEDPVFCINARSDDESDVKIVIKQCPECRSTIIGSSTKIENPPESHESLTIHGTPQLDETNLEYSSDDSGKSTSPSECHCKEKKMCIDLAKLKELLGCSCDKPKMDVVIDSDSVEKSEVKVRELPPLMRRRVCSSMEFDVTTVKTRLREKEIEHKNAHIVLELKQLGVDQILRASKPAKCCRKAILNERQRTALPYCVSLRSLPLMSNDAEVIKQSVDMSVKKIKNAIDLTQAYKDKLAYYVSLGKDDFKQKQTPWVAPLYGMDLNGEEDRFYVLKKEEAEEQVATLLGIVERLRRNDLSYTKNRCFVLRKPNMMRRITEWNESKSSVLSRRINRKRIKRRMELKFRNCKPNRRRRSWRSNIDRFGFPHQFNSLDVNFLQTTEISRFTSFAKCSNSGSDIPLNAFPCFNICNLDNKQQEAIVEKSKGSGDCSLSKMLDFSYLNKPEKSKFLPSVFRKKNSKRKKSLPASNALTIFIPKSKGVKRKKKNVLEYYVGLVKGDLVWSNTLPLVPQNYDTYYNHASERKKVPVEEPIVATRVSRAESSREPTRSPSRSSRRSSGSATRRKRLTLPESNNEPQKTVTSSPEPQQVNAPEMAQVDETQELKDESWFPHVVSDTSLPNIQETFEKKEVEQTEAQPVEPRDDPHEEEFVEQQEEPEEQQEEPEEQQEEPEEQPPPPPQAVKSKCSTKQVCIKHDCKSGCKASKACCSSASQSSSPPPPPSSAPHSSSVPPSSARHSSSPPAPSARHSSSPPPPSQKAGPGDITIAIKKKRKGIVIEGRAPASCNKEVCEIYKNKNLVPDKPEKQQKAKSSSDKPPKEQKFKVVAKDSVEIIINNNTISVTNNDKRKK